MERRDKISDLKKNELRSSCFPSFNVHYLFADRNQITYLWTILVDEWFTSNRNVQPDGNNGAGFQMNKNMCGHCVEN